MRDGRKVEFIGNGYFWVGGDSAVEGLQCNPYLLIEGEEGVLFDPGSVLDFETVMANVESVIPLDRIRYVVLHHQDPDLASAVPLMERAGMRFTIVTHWRTWSLVRYYGISSPYLLVDEHAWHLRLATGRTIRFIPTPYLHFAGSVASYDASCGYLLSSDLFGAFGSAWDLYAGADYIERMKAYHEHYMPSNDILRPVMDLFLRMDIRLVAPQHGSIIRKDIADHILALRDLDCGVLMHTVRRNLAGVGGYSVLVEEVLRRFASLFGEDALYALASRLAVRLDPVTGRITGTLLQGEQLWQRSFEAIYLEKGLSALAVLDPLMKKICTEFGIQEPGIFSSALLESEKETIILTDEVGRLTRLADELNKTIERTRQHMLVCPVTGLYNESFFRTFIEEEAALRSGFPLNGNGSAHAADGFAGPGNGGASPSPEEASLILVGIDEGMARVEYQYGPREVEEILRGVAKILSGLHESGAPLFRLHGANFAVWLPGTGLQAAVREADRIRTQVEGSGMFIERITISAGVICLSQARERNSDPATLGAALYDDGMRRLRAAKKQGGNMVVSSTTVDTETEARGLILIVDDDRVNVDVLKSFLENSDYRVITANDGAEGLKLVETENPDLVIAEIMVPKMDAFVLKENLSTSTATKAIPFIILSHLKDEHTVVRACGLGVDYYIKKPYMMMEVLGVVGNLLRKRSGK